MGQPQAVGSPDDEDWADRSRFRERSQGHRGICGPLRRRSLQLCPRTFGAAVRPSGRPGAGDLSGCLGIPEPVSRDGSLGAWVMGIARHKLEDHYRLRLRAPESIDDVDQDPAVFAALPEFPQLVEQEQMRKITWRVLSSLPEPYRLALIWRYWEKASAREMALKTGKTEKAIERLLARARAEFRERWNHA